MSRHVTNEDLCRGSVEVVIDAEQFFVIISPILPSDVFVQKEFFSLIGNIKLGTAHRSADGKLGFVDQSKVFEPLNKLCIGPFNSQF